MTETRFRWDGRMDIFCFSGEKGRRRVGGVERREARDKLAVVAAVSRK